MIGQGSLLAYVVLGVLISAGGAYLFMWSRGQSRSIKHFAESRGLVYGAGDAAHLEQALNHCVALDEPDLSRSFSQVGDIVSVGDGILFRAVELLDLRAWGRAQYVNQSRVAVMFPFRDSVSGIFSVSPGFTVHQRYPEAPACADRVRSLLEAARVAPPPAPLSLTIMRGQAVAYLEPIPRGTVSRRDLDYLVELMCAITRR